MAFFLINYKSPYQHISNFDANTHILKRGLYRNLSSPPTTFGFGQFEEEAGI